MLGGSDVRGGGGVLFGSGVRGGSGIRGMRWYGMVWETT